MSKPCVLLGCGGHAAVVVDQLRELDVDIMGWVGPHGDGSSLRKVFEGIDYLGSDKELPNIVPAGECLLVNGVGSLPRVSARKKLFDSLKSQGYEFYTLMSASSTISRYAEISEGAQIMPGVVINAGAEIGRNSIMNTGSILEHDCSIGDNCHVAPGAVLSGGVIVENDVHIGTGACIIHGLKIGARAIVGAGSAVTRDVEAGAVVYPYRSTP